MFFNLQSVDPRHVGWKNHRITQLKLLCIPFHRKLSGVSYRIIGPENASRLSSTIHICALYLSLIDNMSLNIILR